MVEIYESYKNYVPPAGVRRIVERLLKSLPAGHLSGLESVVLTSSKAVGKGRTGRVAGRKYQRADCLGFYHRASKTGGAWIEIVVDTMVNGCEGPAPVRWISIELLLGGTLFHEIGHHLDATVCSPARTGEAAADEWRRRLLRRYLDRRYWYVMPLLRLAAPVLVPGLRRKARELKNDLPPSRQPRP